MRSKFLKLFGKDEKKYLLEVFDQRGGTYDTLYHRNAIEGIKIPDELHLFEDAYLHKWVDEHGFKSVINPVGCKHYHTVSPMWKGKKNQDAIKKAIELEILTEKQNLMKLMRPIVGFAPMSLMAIKEYGLIEGLRYAYVNQRSKLLIRWYLWKWGK